MSTRAASTFNVTEWDESPYAEPDEGPCLARTTVTKTFERDLEGESTAEMLMCQANAKDLNAGAGYTWHPSSSRVLSTARAERS